MPETWTSVDELVEKIGHVISVDYIAAWRSIQDDTKSPFMKYILVTPRYEIHLIPLNFSPSLAEVRDGKKKLDPYAHEEYVTDICRKGKSHRIGNQFTGAYNPISGEFEVHPSDSANHLLTDTQTAILMNYIYREIEIFDKRKD